MINQPSQCDLLDPLRRRTEEGAHEQQAEVGMPQGGKGVNAALAPPSGCPMGPRRGSGLAGHGGGRFGSGRVHGAQPATGVGLDSGRSFMSSGLLSPTTSASTIITDAMLPRAIGAL